METLPFPSPQFNAISVPIVDYQKSIPDIIHSLSISLIQGVLELEQWCSSNKHPRKLIETERPWWLSLSLNPTSWFQIVTAADSRKCSNIQEWTKKIPRILLHLFRTRRRTSNADNAELEKAPGEASILKPVLSFSTRDHKTSLCVWNFIQDSRLCYLKSH